MMIKNFLPVSNMPKKYYIMKKTIQKLLNIENLNITQSGTSISITLPEISEYDSIISKLQTIYEIKQHSYQSFKDFDVIHIEIDLEKQVEKEWKKIVLQLKTIAEQKNISQTEIARRTGIRRENITRLFSLRVRPELRTILLISEAINLKLKFQNFEIE